MANWRRFAAVPVTLAVGYFYITRLFLRIRWEEYKHLILRAVRAAKFAIVGILVYVIGNVLLIVMVNVLGWSPKVAYAPETIVSVQLVFLGSWFWTWRERRRETTFWRAWRLVCLYRLVSVGLNIGVFIHLWLDVFGLPLLVANTLNVIIASAWNYSASENVIFAAGQRVRDDFPLPRARQLPSIAIVVPCKRNADSIRATLEAIANQDYLRLKDAPPVIVILVGDPNEETWQAVEDFRQSGLTLIEVEVRLDPKWHRRDANAKRSVGAIYAEDYDIVVFADADILPHHQWLSRIASLMTGLNAQNIVAGPLEGIGDSFWRYFIDRTTSITGSKTPRVPRAILLTAENLGEYKPPVTANLAVSRRVLLTIGEPPPVFTWSYEDYAYVERALAAGFGALIHPLLGVERVHREGFGRLSGEYLRSGNGCGQFISTFQASRFTVWRLVVLMALPVVLMAVAASAVIAPVLTLAGLTAVTISLMLTNLLSTLQVRRIDGLIYPFAGIYFSLRFVYGACQWFHRMGLNRPDVPGVGPARIVYSSRMR